MKEMRRIALVNIPQDATHIDDESFFMKCVNGHLFEKGPEEEEWRSSPWQDSTLTSSIDDLKTISRAEAILYRVKDLICGGCIELYWKPVQNHPLLNGINNELERIFKMKHKVMEHE